MSGANVHPKIIRMKAKNRANALQFAGTLAMLRTKKKTALISIMQQHGLKVREARAVYAEATGKKKANHAHH